MNELPLETPEPEDFHSTLVAYLDGELPPDESRRIEQLLSVDPALRQALQELQSCWEMLESLPQADVDSRFTKTTVEMVAVHAEEDVQHDRQRGSRQRVVWLGMFAMLLLAFAGLGYALTGRFWPDPNRELIANLPLWENFEQLRYVQDVEFLKSLRQADLFTRDVPQPATGNQVPESRRAESSLSLNSTLEARKSHIEQSSSQEKADLQARIDHFHKLNAAEQARMLDFVAQIQREETSDELMEILGRYYDWVTDLPAATRAELAHLDTKQSVRRIQQILTRQSKTREWQLSPEDSRLLVRWIEQMTRESLSDEELKRLQSFSTEREQKRELWLIIGRNFVAKESTGPRITLPQLEQLALSISPTSRKLLDEAPTLEAKLGVVEAWIRNILGSFQRRDRPFQRYQQVSDEELQRFFTMELSEVEKQQLESLPADEILEQLRRLYFLKIFPPTRQRNNPRQQSGKGKRPLRMNAPLDDDTKDAAPQGKAKADLE